MSRKIKLLTLIIMSMSVYFIYNATKNDTVNILSLGDFLTEGINSYEIDNYSYAEYLKFDLESHNTKINLNKYSDKSMSIDKLINLIKTNPKIKKDLKESHILILNVGYNDLLYNQLYCWLYINYPIHFLILHQLVILNPTNYNL